MDRKEERLRRYVHILWLLAEADTKLNKNGIWLQLKGQGLGSEPTILYAIRDLEKWGMIKEVKTKKIVPGGKTFNYYRLTQSGVENLISAGIIRTKSISRNAVRLLLQKCRELLPYATDILDLWPLFRQAEVEDIAVRRLAMFIVNFHGEQLYYYVLGMASPPLVGTRAILKMLAGGSDTRTVDDDVEAFLDPHTSLDSHDAPFPNAEDGFTRWIELVRSSEKLQAIVVRAALKTAYGFMRSNNDTLKLLAVKPISLKDSDAETYRKLVAEIVFLGSTIVTPST